MISHMIKWCSDENEIIFDPYSGSGTTAIAAYLLNRNFLAIEKDPDYHAASVARLDEVRAQGVLF